MAEIKKKRGRPRKEKDEKMDLNEKNKQITMSENNKSSSVTDTVSSMTINTYNAIPTARNVDDVSLEAVQQRWRSIFSKYSTLGFDSIANAWNSSYSALNNPFIQNARIKQINSRAQKLSKEELQQAVSNPENSENSLCSVSMHLYYTNYIYYNLVCYTTIRC